MFQYFYLISLLLCINLVFSYEYIDDAPDVPRKPFRSLGKNVKRLGTSGKRKEKKSLIRQEYGYDKNPVEFDVAGFIQPDEETIADEEVVRHRNQRRRRILKNNDYNSLLGLNMEEGANNRDVNQGYLNFRDPSVNLSPALMNLSPPLLKDSMNDKEMKMSAMDDSNAKYGNDFKNLLKNQIVIPEQNPAHNPQKKCILKKMKLPFFPRSNKSETSKPKNNKKRKLFCFNYPKKSTKENLNQNGVQVELIPKDKKTKRSYQESLCPACKQSFLSFASNDNGKRISVRNMHNRLISEKHTDGRVKEPYKDDSNTLTNFNSEDYRETIEDTQRIKREDPGILMRRELDVIQQTIEHEDVRSPSNVKSTTTNVPE